jgi:excisionase family DNA binding protein
MARRRPNWRAIKLHYSYTPEEAARTLGVSKGTVRRWLKEGLPHITDQRPFLILGGDLRDFLENRKKLKQQCELYECFCFHCRQPSAAAGRMMDYIPQTARSGRIIAICDGCGTIMHKAFSPINLPSLMREVDVSFPKGQPRIVDMTNPLVNDHFEKGPRP